MEDSRSGCLFEQSQFAVVEAVLQIPVVQVFLQHDKDQGQQFVGSGTQGFARSLLAFLRCIELSQGRRGPWAQRQDGPNSQGAKRLRPRLVILPCRVVWL